MNEGLFPGAAGFLGGSWAVKWRGWILGGGGKWSMKREN